VIAHFVGICSPRSAGKCCIAGGGPAGLALGYLLARPGIEVLVLKKHGDFLSQADRSRP
jgi:2-polyprenyl-6-methoxyphenol hydroxylase-like FAD-dependent oxidoreductase